MELFIIVAVVVFGLIMAGLGIVLAVAQRTARTNQAPELAGKRPQGYWMGVGIAYGILLGYALALIMGIAMDDMQFFIIFGPGVGMTLGVAIGAALEQRHKDETRPLTAEEQRARKWAMLVGVVLVVLGLLAMISIMIFA